MGLIAEKDTLLQKVRCSCRQLKESNKQLRVHVHEDAMQHFIETLDPGNTESIAFRSIIFLLYDI
jgi:hypothetical protein